MPLGPGTRVGPYEIVSAIGAGGMGEVYRARDTRLKRDVALKILPESFASDPDRLARFQREAEVLASLNHPNIAAIHGLEESDGTRALVMELVEGETLADRIARGPIPVDEALPIAKQIAEALETAHEQGIIHRDLKPANIKVRPDGTVKVLDFGLAKLVEANGPISSSAQSALSLSPTITSPVLMSGVGALLGTAAYMSPEQAKGRPADKRSDIWAFGCVLYEMLAGQGPFAGEDVSDTLANVLKREPDWNALPKDVPAAVCTLVQRCLAKDRLKRVSDISAAKFVLGELSHITSPPDPPTTVAAVTASRWRRQTVAAVVVTAALAAIVVAAAAWALRPTPRPLAVARFSFALPGEQTFSGTTGEVVGVSPDGTRVAYSANSRIFLRSIDDPEPRAIAGTETVGLGLWNPIFAPDGRSLAYFSIESSTSATVKRIAVSGGAPSTVGSVGIPFGASWGTAGILIGRPEGVLRISPDGGIPERIISVAADEVAHRPQLLPDGRTVLFTVAKRAADDPLATLTYPWDKAQIVAQSTAGGARRVLIDGGSDARYVPTGHLIYAVGGTMFAVVFDAETLTVTGSPVPVVVGVARSAGAATGSALLALSDSGTLVYRRGPASGSTSTRSLVIGDERGVMPLKIPPAQYSHPRASRDGKVLALSRSDGSQSDIWTYDLSGQSEIRRLTFGGSSRYPVWSADSRRLAFQSARDGDRAIYWQLADGTGAASRLTKPAQGEEHVPESWSPDGRHLLFSVKKEMTFSLWVLTLDGAKIEPFGRVQSSEPFGATFSPDGRWVAYASNDAPVGTQSPNRGVFIEPFPPTGEKHQAPKRGLDFHPVWTPDGRAILYVPSSSRPIVRMPVATRPSVAFGAPEELRDGPQPQLLSIDVRGYDILQDGRLVSLARALDIGPTATSRPEIDVVLNWTEELKQRVPVK